MSISPAWPQVLDFFSAPLAIGQFPGHFSIGLLAVSVTLPECPM
jgi:hypothetical protein